MRRSVGRIIILNSFKMTREQKEIVMTVRRLVFVTPFIAGVLGGLSVALAAVPKYSVETVPEYDAVFERTVG